MIIVSKTPVRISFFGGGTDYPEYFNEFGGSVLSTTINKYMYHILKPFEDPDYLFKLRYSKIELVKSVDDIKHPSMNQCFKFLDIKQKLEIDYEADITAKTGLGTSSAFTVGLLKALSQLKFYDSLAGEYQLAKTAIHIERNLIKERVGWQDQIAAAFGGFNKIEFGNDDFIVKRIELPIAQQLYFWSNLLLVDTGHRRFAHEVLEEQVKKTEQGLNNEYLTRMKEFVCPAEKYLLKGAFDDFGKLLHETWMLKRKLSSKVSLPEIDEMYEIAIKNGALGGKLLGAGGGGFLLLYADPRFHFKIKEKLKNYKFVDFYFDLKGSRIV